MLNADFGLLLFSFVVESIGIVNISYFCFECKICTS